MFKRWLIAGLLVWLPLVITLWVLNLIIDTLEAVVPAEVSSQALLGTYVPGFKVAVVLVVLLLTGMLVANFLGQRLLHWWERLLARIPLVRSIYQSVKQVSDTVLAPNGQAFRKAVLLQYPRQGAWTLGFLTGSAAGELAEHLPGEHVSVYVPSTPNPTSGFFILVPRDQLVELSMSVDSALKYVVSMGVVAPPPSPRRS